MKNKKEFNIKDIQSILTGSAKTIITTSVIICILFIGAEINTSPVEDHSSSDYSEQLAEITTHVNIDSLIQVLQNSDQNTYMWYIEEDYAWSDLHQFLPEAKNAGITVWVSILPPSLSPPICGTCNYSEPYHLDFITWAREIAKLSLRYSNFKGYTIKDLPENLQLGYLSQTYIDSVIAEGNSINPHLQFLTTGRLGNVFYVDRDANGNGDGISWVNAAKTLYGLPWQSIVGGDTIYVSGGTDSTAYLTVGGTPNDNNTPATTNTSYIVITKSDDSGHNGDVYFTQIAGTPRTYSLRIAAQFIKLTNVIINIADGNDSQDNETCLALSNTNHVTVDNCTIISNGTAVGIYMNTCSYITINNCTVNVEPNNLPYNQDNIFFSTGNGGHKITNNTLYNAGINNTPHNDLIQFGASGSISKLTTVIANNKFFYIAEGDPAHINASIYVTISHGDRYLIYNNLFVNAIGTQYFTGIAMTRYDANSHLSANIFNNTYVAGVANAIFGQIGIMDSLRIENNIVVNTAGGRGCWLTFINNIATYPYKLIDYNHYWSINPPNYPYINDNIGSSKNWGQWQALGYDTHSDTGTVTFANVWDSSSVAYKLVTGSAGIDQGTELNEYFTKDILGILRPQEEAWDIGATEQ